MHRAIACAALAAVVVAVTAASVQTAPRITVERHADIGVLRGNSMHLVGRIADVAADARGNIFVLDDRLNDLRAFDSIGRFIARTGRAGQGPGEFTVPGSISMLPTGRVAVLDEANQRLSVFELGPDTLQLISSLRIPRGGNDVCSLGSDFIIYAFVDGKVLRRFTPQGRLIASFGRPLSPIATPIAQHTEASGPIVCVPETDIVVYTSRYSPTIAAIHADGRAVWETTLKDFTLPSLAPSNGRMRVSVPAAGHYHRIRSAFLVSPTVLAIQLLRMGPSPRLTGDLEMGVDTRFIALDTGAEIGAQQTLPLLTHFAGTRAYGSRPDSFPLARVYRAQFTAGR